jgi:hypothetical protein
MGKILQQIRSFKQTLEGTEQNREEKIRLDITR